MTKEKKKNKSKKQFSPSGTSIASTIWKVLVVLLILSIFISAGIATIVGIFFPAPSTDTSSQTPLTQQQLQLLQQQLEQQQVQSTTTAPVNTLRPTK